MTADEYIATRLDEQIAWYDQRSVRSQRWYKGLRIIEIVVAASIPFMVGYITEARPSVAFVVGLAGVAVAVISGLLAITSTKRTGSSTAQRASPCGITSTDSSPRRTRTVATMPFITSSTMWSR